MSRKPQVRHIAQPKTKSRADQLRFQAELRGERPQKKARTFDIRKFLILSAVIVAVAMLIFGLCFGKVIEENLFLEIAKYVVMYIPICAIFETFAYILAPLAWHIKYDDKNNDSLD